MFELIRVFPTHASPYVGGYVDFDRQYTVGEFIEETLGKYPAISGSFVVDATSLVAHYRKGKLLNEEFPEKVLKARIAAVSFCTGWNKADYVITKLDGQ
jgi:hypothetical protein